MAASGEKVFKICDFVLERKLKKFREFCLEVFYSSCHGLFNQPQSLKLLAAGSESGKSLYAQ